MSCLKLSFSDNIKNHSATAAYKCILNQAQLYSGYKWEKNPLLFLVLSVGLHETLLIKQILQQLQCTETQVLCNNQKICLFNTVFISVSVANCRVRIGK